MNNYFKFASIASLVMVALIAIPSPVEATTLKPIQPTDFFSSKVLKKLLVLQNYTPQCTGQQCSTPVNTRGSGTR